MLITVVYIIAFFFVYFLGVGITKIVLDNTKEVPEEDKGFVCSLWPIFLFMCPLIICFRFFFCVFPEIITGKKDEES